MLSNNMVRPANPIWNPWANDKNLLDLYRRRCRNEISEMTCATQAADILKKHITPNESILDAGCGAGYYYHAFAKMAIPFIYHGIDFTPQMVALAKEEIETHYKNVKFDLCAIEDLEGEFDNVVCFNVLTNSPHYAQPLHRLLQVTKKRLILRDNLHDKTIVRYHPDLYLDADKRHIHVYHNQYSLQEVVDFIEDRGFKVAIMKDIRTNDGVETVCDIPYHWRILFAERV